jgi:hypothetical protein
LINAKLHHAQKQGEKHHRDQGELDKRRAAPAGVPWRELASRQKGKKREVHKVTLLKNKAQDGFKARFWPHRLTPILHSWTNV